MIKKCPRCNQTFVVSNECSDYEHKCNSGNELFDKEDVTITGNWDDGDGNTGTIGAQAVMRQGAENTFFGKEISSVNNEKNHELTRHGNTKTTHRQRQHYEFINLKKEGLD